MLPGMELMGCPELAVPADVMHHVVRVESSFNPFAIGVVGGRLARQPASLAEAVATSRMLERRGYNFSVGLAQVNRYNLGRYGIEGYERAFQACPNLQAGARILADCHARSGGDWGKSFSCYYSGNFTTGFRHGYVQKVYDSMRAAADEAGAIPVLGTPARRRGTTTARAVTDTRIAARTADAPAIGRTSPAAPAAASDAADDVVVLKPRAEAPAPAAAAQFPTRDSAFVF